MKQIYIQDTKQNLAQNLKRMADASFDCYQSKLKCKVIRTTVQNHPSVGGAGGRLCKGPPGRPRSPGGYYADHPPDGGVGPPNEVVTPVGVMNQGKDNPKNISEQQLKSLTFGQKANIPLNTEYQTRTNFYTQLNFTNMKKQILILMVALIASVTVAFGQLPRSINALTPLTCAGTATFLNPVSGVPYDYSMNGTTGADQVSQWQWFATKDPNFMTASGTFTSNKLTVSTGQLLNATNYNTLGASATVTITWTPEILANTVYQGTPSLTGPSPTFVVGYGKGTNCADNIKVYEINPVKNFIASIAPIDPATSTSTTWGSTTSSCVANVVSATYSGTNLVVDYGVNTVYFEIGAANFVTDFTPYISLVSGLRTGQTAVITLHNTLGDAQTNANVKATHNWVVGDVGSTWSTTTQFTAANASDVVNGVSLFAKVVITNSYQESLTDNPLILAVDAKDKTDTGIWDMENTDCASLVDAPDKVDQATQNIKPRPTIIGANVPDANVTLPNDLVPKNP